MDKRDRAMIFRDRLATAMAAAGQSQTGLARAIAADRSTVSQLLSGESPRLPNAQIAAEIALALGVSVDWLLGLSQRKETTAELIAAAVSMPEAPRALVDETIFAWHREAEGYKIRHVPATLPDMLKTEDVLRWEYGPSLGRTIDQAIGASQDRLNWMRAARSDYEIAIPLPELQSFALGQGYYAGLSAPLRRGQLDYLLRLHDQLYPRLRVVLFDPQRVYSAPVTIFGPLLAAVYLGRNYLVFRDSARVAAITAHFDNLLREASHGDRELPGVIAGLIARARL